LKSVPAPLLPLLSIGLVFVSVLTKIKFTSILQITL
jgi:hypothetical protein